MTAVLDQTNDDVLDVLPAPVQQAITKMVQRKLHMLNSAGKADVINKQWEKLGKPMPAYYGKK